MDPTPAPIPLPNPLPIPFRVTQASLNQTAFDFPRNMKNIFAAIDEAVRQQADLLALEELTLTGYDAGDDFEKTDNTVMAELLQDIASYAFAKNPNLVISIGHPWRLADKDVTAPPNHEEERRKNALFNRINLPFNVQSFLGGGRILGMTAKSYLFNYERGYEKRYFAEWSAADADQNHGKHGTLYIEVPGQAYPVPFGRPVLRLEGEQGAVNLAHIICEEKWVGSRFDDGNGTDRDYARDAVLPALTRRLGAQGLIAVMPDASPPVSEKIKKHAHLAQLAAHYADAVVNTDGVGSSGSTFAQFGHRLIAQKGKLISYGPRLGFARVNATSKTFFVSPADTNPANAVFTSLAHDFNVPQYLKKDTPLYQSATWDRLDNPDLAREENLRMLALWLFDYVRKNRINGIVEALSGGMDSAFNSVVVAVMIRLAMTELGPDGFCEEMRHLPFIGAVRKTWDEGGLEAAAQECLKHFLTTIFMGTANSSTETEDAARFLIEGGNHEGQQVNGLGGTFIKRNVQDLVNFYALSYAVENSSHLSDATRNALLRELNVYVHLRPGALNNTDFQRVTAGIRARYPELEGDILSAANPHHLLAYENVQARVRQVLIMMVAGVEGKMAIANPNLDEGRNAYATFGGDLHSGTVNLNGSTDKTRQMNLMRYLADHGLEGAGRFPSLYKVLSNEPSAELQPRDAQGRVVQNDQDALERSFAQMDFIANRMLRARTGSNSARRLNPSEVFAACARDPLFKGLSDSALYNQVRLSYHRWGIAQHKIHASPITPTDGNAVDHQTSLRTPNLSGNDRAELTQLGLSLLFTAAKAEVVPPPWVQEEAQWQKRALLDEAFVSNFESALRFEARHAPRKTSFYLDGLVKTAQTKGLAALFGPVPAFINDLVRSPLPHYPIASCHA